MRNRKAGEQFQLALKLSHPRALEHHLPRRAVMAVDDHAYLALELDNLKD